MRVSGATPLVPPPLFDRSRLNSEARMEQLMRDSIDLMSDMAASSLKEIDYLGAERKQRYQEKQTVDAEVDESYRKLGKLSQFDTFLSCVQVATSLGLSVASGNPIALASAAFGAIQLFNSATGWITDPTLKGGLKWLSLGTGVATFLGGGPVAASEALKGVLATQMAGNAARGVSTIYHGQLTQEKTKASNASSQFRADLADLSLRSDAVYSGIEENTSVHQSQWGALVSAIDKEAAARRRTLQIGR